MNWKDAYRRNLRKKSGQNEVAMEFVNHCRGLLEGKYLIETTSIRLVNNEYLSMGFRVGNLNSSMIVYVNKPKWTLDLGGGGLYDGHDYNIEEFSTQIEKLLAKEHDAEPEGDEEYVDPGMFDVPEVWNVTPVGLMKGQAKR